MEGIYIPFKNNKTQVTRINYIALHFVIICSIIIVVDQSDYFSSSICHVH